MVWTPQASPSGDWTKLPKAVTLVSGLVSHWRLDEDSGTRFDAHGPNDLTPSNGVGNGAGKIGDAVQLVSANQDHLVSALNPSVPSGNVDFTIVSWFLLDTKVNFPDIFAKGPDVGGAAGYEYDFFYSTGVRLLTFAVTFPNGLLSDLVRATSFGEPPTGQFIFAICRHDSVAQTMSIQINDGAVDSVSKSVTTQPTAGTGRLSMGAFDPLGFPNFHFDGKIDSPSIYDRVLTAQEGSALYNNGDGLDFLWSSVAVPESVWIEALKHAAELEFAELAADRNAAEQLAIDGATQAKLAAEVARGAQLARMQRELAQREAKWRQRVGARTAELEILDRFTAHRVKQFNAVSTAHIDITVRHGKAGVGDSGHIVERPRVWAGPYI